MKRSDAIARLGEHETGLKQLGVQRLYLLGSTARGDARDDSDEGRFGLFDLGDVQECAPRIVDGKADVMTRDSIHKTLRNRIEATSLRVF